MTFIFEWLKTIFSLYKRAQRVSKILFLTRENNSRIFKLPCNVLFISLLIKWSQAKNCEISRPKANWKKVTWSISSLVKIWKISHCVFFSISLATI